RILLGSNSLPVGKLERYFYECANGNLQSLVKLADFLYKLVGTDIAINGKQIVCMAWYDCGCVLVEQFTGVECGYKLPGLRDPDACFSPSLLSFYGCARMVRQLAISVLPVDYLLSTTVIEMGRSATDQMRPTWEDHRLFPETEHKSLQITRS